MRMLMRVSFGLLSSVLFLTGCSLTTSAIPDTSTGRTVQGGVHGGQAPISGAHVHLLAAGTGGYGTGSSSLLTSGDGSDSIGFYVVTDSNGSFSISGRYTCSAGQQAYVYATGGNSGSYSNNISTALMAALGDCPGTNYVSTVPYIWVNEVTTVATAYSIAGFATDGTHVASNNTALGKLGMKNAFANVANIVNIATGAAYTSTHASGSHGTVPVSKINTLANILAACVNSSSTGVVASAVCQTLFAYSPNDGVHGDPGPSDTATAILNIAHHPGTDVAGLFALQQGIASDFQPSLSSASNDLALYVSYTGNLNTVSAGGLAVDGSGNIWVSNYDGNNLYEFGPTGVVSGPFSDSGIMVSPGIPSIDPASGKVWLVSIGLDTLSQFSSAGVANGSSPFSGGGLSGAGQTAVDASGNVWAANFSNNSISKFNSSGTAISGSSGYTGGGLNHPLCAAIDSSGNVWASNYSSNVLSKFNSSGSALSGSGYSGGGLSSAHCLAIDSSGNVWVANNNSSISKFDSSGSSSSGPFSGSGLGLPLTVAIDGSSTVWAGNSNNAAIVHLGNDGSALSFYSSGYTNADKSWYVVVDGSGNLWSVNKNNTITQFLGIATPVVTPITPASLGVKP